MIISGCLPFIVTNSNIMSKVQESFKTGKFRPGIEFSICSNQFHLPWKTAAKGWNWYQRWPWRNRTHISVWKIPTGKTGLPFQTYRCSRKFSTETTRKVVFHLLFILFIFQKLFVNDTQPQRTILKLHPSTLFLASPTTRVVKTSILKLMDSCFFKLCRVYSNLLKLSNVGEFPRSWFLGHRTEV